MNKEKMEDKTIKIMSRKYYSKYVVDKLVEENKQLKQRIDKAIEHLNLFIWEEQLSKYDTLKILTHTKEILKGE